MESKLQKPDEEEKEEEKKQDENDILYFDEMPVKFFS